PLAAWSESRSREVLDKVNMPALFLDARGTVVWCNRFLLSLLDAPAAEVIGQTWIGRFAFPDEAPRISRAGEADAGTASRGSGEPAERRARGGERRAIEWQVTEVGSGTGESGTFLIGVDVTERRRTEERLRQGAMLDALTGLPNRNLFMDRLAGCMARAKRR